MEKPTAEELNHYYKNNRKYFNELANYYYKTDPEFYKQSIAPYFTNPPAREFVCPYCRQSMVPVEYVSPSMYIARITLFITSGFLFICSLVLSYFFSILFGLFFIFIAGAAFLTGLFYKNVRKRCSRCNAPIPALLLK